jgi:lipopolysaccharide export system protein LptC
MENKNHSNNTEITSQENKNSPLKSEEFSDNVQVLHPKDKNFSYSAETSGRSTGFQKHNRIVLFLKLLMPSFAVIAIALMILWPKIAEQKDKFRLGVTRPLLVSQTDNLSIVNSQFFSSDSKNQPFVLSADLAIETEPNSRIINLTKPKASILLNNGMRINVVSDSGILYQQKNNVTLSGNCTGSSSEGHRLETEEVLIDLNNDSLIGKHKTFFHFPQGNIESDGLSVKDKGDIIKFTGNARMLITLNKQSKPNEISTFDEAAE